MLQEEDIIMFEITFRGRTMQFDSAQEMEEWRQRMMSPKTGVRRKRSPKKKQNEGLKDVVKRAFHSKSK